MSFLRAARAALSGATRVRLALTFAIAAVGLLSLSCGGGPYTQSGPNHIAYVTLPDHGSVLIMQINGMTGEMTKGAETPFVQGASPYGLALGPNKKFLYVVNAQLNRISIFNVNSSDGTLTLTGVPTQAQAGAFDAVIDPSGKYLLVTNNTTAQAFGSISVFAIASDGSLTPGQTITASLNPQEIIITPTSNYVYVTDPVVGQVQGFTFSGGILTAMPGPVVVSGAGASGLVVDRSERFLYVANLSAHNQFVQTVGNVSGFSIGAGGALTPILGSPFTVSGGAQGPTAVTVDPSGQFIYAVTQGSSNSVWCFAITPQNGQLTAVANSPFSLAAGGLFAVFDPIGNYFYIGSSSPVGVQGYTFNSSTGALTLVPNSPFSTGVAPGKMVLSE